MFSHEALAAFLGAFSAFLLEAWRRWRSERRADLGAGNEAVFVLSQYHSLLSTLNQQAYIKRSAHVRNTLGRDPIYAEYIAAAAPWNSALHLPLDRLGFILRTYDPNLLGRLATLERTIISLFEAQQTRNSQHMEFQKGMADLERHSAPRAPIAFEDIEAHVGRNLALQLRQSTEFILTNLPDCIQKIPAVAGHLSALLSHEFPFGRAIQFSDPNISIDVEAASAVPPIWRRQLRRIIKALRGVPSTSIPKLESSNVNQSGKNLIMKSWAFWIPTIIAVVALTFPAAQWYESREQRHLAFDATIVIDVDTLLSDHRVGMAIRNIGPGVARLRSVTYYVDRKPADDPDEVLDEAKLDSNRDWGVDMDRGDSMAPGELDWLVDYHAEKKEDEDLAVDFVEKHLKIAVDYSTGAGVDKRVCSDVGGCK
jgi:hypothetical protein